MSNASIEVLAVNLKNMISSIRWLKRSWQHCQSIGIKSEYADHEFDEFENLTSRYARTTDLIIGKMLRSMDVVELLEPGSLIDAAHRAEKRGIIDSVSHLRDLKDLRNEIAHEYETDDLASLFASVLEAVPELIAIASRLEAYCSRYVAD